eukprot:TRINITY_DN13403_c0_g1_i2.p1 TRINITY_DN13403_c0_g1~~TRINITY_DN13403_c0_g1_i2.p1  ORF type:complete len:101 (-),score=19.62 TRINITY_DN13403_c0_g1_i2:122-424(-)
MCIRDSLYSMQIIDGILKKKETPQDHDRSIFIEEFTKKGGIHHLIYALMTLPLDKTFNSLTQKNFVLILKALFIMLSSICLLYTSPSPRDLSTSRMPSSA